jgi:hypothetical protein
MCGNYKKISAHHNKKFTINFYEFRLGCNAKQYRFAAKKKLIDRDSHECTAVRTDAILAADA